jgi:hypothetical protein
VTASVSVESRGPREARLRGRHEVGELAEIVSIVALRQRESAAKVAGEWRRVTAGDASVAERQAVLEERLTRLQADLERCTEGVSWRRRRNAAVLREQVDLLRSHPGVRYNLAPYSASVNGQLPSPYTPASPAPVGRQSGRLGTVLMYAGALLLIWLVLWQVALAVGFR